MPKFKKLIDLRPGLGYIFHIFTEEKNIQGNLNIIKRFFW